MEVIVLVKYVVSGIGQHSFGECHARKCFVPKSDPLMCTYVMKSSGRPLPTVVKKCTWFFRAREVVRNRRGSRTINNANICREEGSM